MNDTELHQDHIYCVLSTVYQSQIQEWIDTSPFDFTNASPAFIVKFLNRMSTSSDLKYQPKVHVQGALVIDVNVKFIGDLLEGEITSHQEPQSLENYALGIIANLTQSQYNDLNNQGFTNIGDPVTLDLQFLQEMIQNYGSEKG